MKWIALVVVLCASGCTDVPMKNMKGVRCGDQEFIGDVSLSCLAPGIAPQWTIVSKGTTVIASFKSCAIIPAAPTP